MTTKACISIILSLVFPFLLQGQTENKESRFHTGLFLQGYGTTQFFSYDLASGEVRPGLCLGIYEHFDLSHRFQLRLGGAYSFSTLYSKDYSPNFPGDFDPSTGEVDVYKSYITNEVDLQQIYIPLHVRYKFSDAGNHFFVATGLEYRIVIQETFDARIYESGVILLEFDPEPFYASRNPNLAGHLEFGYEFPWSNNKLNISVFSKYALKTQIEGEGQAFYGLYQGHAIDFGVGAELIF